MEIPIIWSGLPISRKPKSALLTSSKLRSNPSLPSSKNLPSSPGSNSPIQNPLHPSSMMISSILTNSLKSESKWVMLNSHMRLSGIRGKVRLHLSVMGSKIMKRRKGSVAYVSKVPKINSRNNSLTLTIVFWWSNQQKCSKWIHWDKKYSWMLIEQANNQPKKLPILAALKR